MKAILIQGVGGSPVFDARRLRNGVALEGIRVEPGAAGELPAGGMKGLRAGLQHHVEDAAAGLAVLRVIGVLLDVELLHRVDDRHVGNVIAASLRIVRRAVHHELIVRLAAAVDGPLGDSPVVKRTLPDGGPAENHARHHRAQHERIAAVERKFRDRDGVDDAGAGSGLRFEQRGFTSDIHRVRQRADLKHHIDTGDLAHLDGQVFAVAHLKALRRHRQFITAGTQERNRVSTGSIAGSVGRFVIRSVDRADRCVGYGRPGRVENPSRNRRAEFLRQRHAGDYRESKQDSERQVHYDPFHL